MTGGNREHTVSNESERRVCETCGFEQTADKVTHEQLDCIAQANVLLQVKPLQVVFMSDEIPEPVREAFAAHDAYKPGADGFALTSITFDAELTVTETDGTVLYSVVVSAPTLDAATADTVGDAVVADWLRTLRLRAKDAPKATRAAVELDEFTVTQTDDEVQIEYQFAWERPTQAANIAKAFAEFAEGTYAEGIVPGYEYEPPVSNLLARASHDGASGTPL